MTAKMTNFEKINSMTNEEALEIVTNTIQSRPMTILQDKALSIAQRALLKQTSKPIEAHEFKGFTDVYMACPSCGNSGIVNINGKYFNYCPNCGQALDWGDSE